MASVSARALVFDRRGDDRTQIARPAVLSLDGLSHPIRVDDLTRGGCKITTDIDLIVGSTVTLGFAGVGRTSAQIVRHEAGAYGCTFDELLAPGAVTAATRNNVDHFAGPDMPVHAVQSDDVKWSPRGRVLLIAGICGLSWAAVIAGSLLVL